MPLGKVLLSAAFVAAILTPALAQGGGAIRGVVHEPGGDPMPGVVVTVSHPRIVQVRVAITDLHGRYEISGLDTGTHYDVQVSHPRYRKVRLQAQPSADQQALSVALKPRSGLLTRR